jgi:CHAT domain-containing protein
LEQALDDRRSLLIAGDSFLSGVPWAATVLPDGTYFGEKHRIVLTPGLFYHPPRWVKPETYQGQEVLIAQPGAATLDGESFSPLPDAEAESRFLSDIYAGDSVFLREQDVNVHQLLSLLPESSIFLFAGHALSRDSGGELLLSGSAVLSAADLASLHMSRSRLVVLAACSTALVEHDIARNPDGLVRAFLSAGAGTVVASRWDVESGPTRGLIESFFQSVRQGRPPADALRIARGDLRANRDTEHPYYWASFEVFGMAN